MKQIYTGYQWRPMTGPELEIMEASRIVDEKTDDAQAGDIYEATDKCPYCIGDRNASPSLIRERVDVYLHYNTLVVEFPTENSWGDVDKKINFCPMCGRKLEVPE